MQVKIYESTLPPNVVAGDTITYTVTAEDVARGFFRLDVPAARDRLALASSSCTLMYKALRAIAAGNVDGPTSAARTLDTIDPSHWSQP